MITNHPCTLHQVSLLPQTSSGLVQVIRLAEEPVASSQGAFTFNTGPLQLAGPHTLTAEWQELRPGLSLGSVKAPACSVVVTAGPPVEVEVCSLPCSLIEYSANWCFVIISLRCKRVPCS